MHTELEWILRLIAAAVMGGLIGFERHNRAKEAGIRTHVIVAMASCLLMIVSKYGFFESGNPDPARVAAQVVSGVGFLGAGIIFIKHDTIQGLTTAAGIWGTSAIGLCFGSGLYVLGFFAGFAIFLIQLFFQHFFVFHAPRTVIDLRVYLTPDGKTKDVYSILKASGYTFAENKISSDENGGWILEAEITTLKEADPSQIVSLLCESDHIRKAEIL